MEGLMKSRAAATGWLTRAAKDLEEALAKENVNSFELSDLLDEFNKRMNRVDDIQFQIEDVLPVEDLERNIEEAHTFRKKYRSLKSQAESVFNSKVTVTAADKNSSASEVNSVHSSDHSRRVDNKLSKARLPKLEIPKFGGNYLEYFSFCDKFNAVVDGSDLPPVTKLTYLQSLLTGEALASINGLSITDKNYQVTREILQQRYGRKERVIFAHIQKFLNLPSTFKSLNDLWKFYDVLQTHIRCLETLEVTGEAYGVILTPLVLNKLPTDICMEWAREGEGKESDLAFLLSFLYNEIKRRERSLSFQNQMSKSGLDGQGKRMPNPSVAAFHAVSTEKKRGHGLCNFCKRNNHISSMCYSLKKLSKDEIKGKLRSLKLCFICFEKHLARDCQKSCTNCKGKHNKLLCYEDDHSLSAPGEGNVEPVSKANNVGFAHSHTTNSTTVMQVVSTTVVGKGGQHFKVDILFDSGADRSFITTDLVKKLNLKPKGRESLSMSNFGQLKPGRKTERRVYELSIGDVCLTLTGIDSICPEMYRDALPSKIVDKFETVSFSENLKEGRLVKVDILIGPDFYWKLVTPDILTEAVLVAQRTICGWMLSGCYKGCSKGAGVQLLCVGMNVTENIPDNADCNIDYPMSGLEAMQMNVSLNSKNVEPLLEANRWGTLRKATNALYKMYGSNCPKWQFSVPRAPWWGGWWERLIKNMKMSLKKSIGVRSLERSELETVLIEIEACINSRPLGFVGDDIQNGNTLTPSHFLLVRGGYLDKVDIVPIPVSTNEDILERENMSRVMIQGFWQRWKDEYIKNLPLPRSRDKYGKVKVGSVVLIREDNCPRLQWPIGVVEKLITGRDGITRTVSVKTKNGSYLRPIQRIHDLELNASPEWCRTETQDDKTEDTCNVSASQHGGTSVSD